MNTDTILSLLKYGGIVVAGISGLLGTLTRTHDAKRKLTSWGKVSISITILSLIVTLGAQYTEGIRQQRQDADSIKNARELREENAKILNELQEQKSVQARAEREFREKFQAVLIQLDAAKHEDSKKITEEKIRVIQKDFAEWATNFAKNYPTIKSEIDQTRQDFEQGKLPSQISETKKEIQISEETFSVISFAVRNAKNLHAIILSIQARKLLLIHGNYRKIFMKSLLNMKYVLTQMRFGNFISKLVAPLEIIINDFGFHFYR